MKPDILRPLFVSIDTVKGVGPKSESLFRKLGINKSIDLLWHLPTSISHRTFVEHVSRGTIGSKVTFIATVLEHVPSHNPRQPYRVKVSDGQSVIDLVFFKMDKRYIRRLLPVNEVKLISGTLDLFNGTHQMTHPDHIGEPRNKDNWVGTQTVYPLTAGLTSKGLARTIQSFLPLLPDLPEWIPPALLEKNAWPSWRQAITKLHTPQTDEDLWGTTKERQRLAYDELLANQLTLSLIRYHFQTRSGESLVSNNALVPKAVSLLPFQLTASQEEAFEEIKKDLEKPMRMLRLLQGDVGSGKTIVALLTMLVAVENGGQAAILAPTEILAKQHFANLSQIADQLGIKVSLLIGSMTPKEKRDYKEQLAQGKIHIAVGTHALIQEDVIFKDLKVAIIDEQHRFGVNQRLALTDKGNHVDVLLMTATPIPRTMVLASYGDIATSQLKEKPKGRKEIMTRVMPLDRMDDIVESLKRVLDRGEKIYWVCPLVEESDVMDYTAAAQRFEMLSPLFPGKVGLVHGQMKDDEKETVMAQFKEGDVDILVATTVIEVGVDVPQATIMVIENAQQFGLSQLHQLRGRVGRNDLQSSCLLLYGHPISEIGRARLQIMRDTNDGFIISEEDLKLRGGGDIVGTRQSGLPPYKVADPFMHAHLLGTATKHAHAIVERDPFLKSTESKSIRLLLHLFDKEDSLIKLNPV